MANLVAINSAVLTSDTASVTFSGISNTYFDLVIRMSVKTDRVNDLDFVVAQFNGDTGSNYDYLRIGTSDGSYNNFWNQSASSAWCATINGNTGTNYFGAGWLYISGANKTTNYKTGDGASAGLYDPTPIGWSYMHGIAWKSNSAISSILLKPFGGTNFKAQTRFDLYGIVTA